MNLHSLHRTALALFLLGFVLKFFHLQYNAVLMLLAIALLITANALMIILKKKSHDPLGGFTLTAWLCVLLITIKFLPFAFAFLIIAIILSGWWMLKRKSLPRAISLYLPTIAMIVALVFLFLPKEIKYHTLNIRFNHEIETDYRSWDKYSWFLYHAGKYSEALEASEQALTISTRHADHETTVILQSHKEHILNRDWQGYRSH